MKRKRIADRDSAPVVPALLTALFAGFFICDCAAYSEAYSAPLWAFALVRFIAFGLPAGVCFAVRAWMLRASKG